MAISRWPSANSIHDVSSGGPAGTRSAVSRYRASANLAGTRMAGFVLTRQGPSANGAKATYALKRDCRGRRARDHRGHRGHRDPSQSHDANGSNHAGSEGPMTPMTPMISPSLTIGAQMAETALNAAQILRIAHTAGVTVRLDGEALVLEADDEPPQAVLEALTRFKPAIVALLTPRDSNWTTDDWWRYFNRRVAAARPRLSQMHAESFAFDCCLIEWLNQHLAPSAPGQCTWCRRPETSQGIVLPFGTEPGTHLWLTANAPLVSNSQKGCRCCPECNGTCDWEQLDK